MLEIYIPFKYENQNFGVNITIRDMTNIQNVAVINALSKKNFIPTK